MKRATFTQRELITLSLALNNFRSVCPTLPTMTELDMHVLMKKLGNVTHADMERAMAQKQEITYTLSDDLPEPGSLSGEAVEDSWNGS